MKKYLFIIVVLLLIAIALIARTLGDARKNTPRGQAFDSPFILQLESGKETVVLEDGSTIRLLSIKENRCPEDVTCVWAGYADVELEVTVAGKTAENIVLRLGTVSGEDLSDQVEWNGMTIKLLNLEPLPNTKALIRLEQMKVALQADRK